MKKIAMILIGIIPFTGITQDLNEKLMEAVRDGVPGAVASLAKSGADVNTSDYDGVTPLMVAARSGNWEVVEALLNNNAYLFWKDRDGLTAFDYAVEGGDSKTISIIQNRLPDDPMVIEKDWDMPEDIEMGLKFEVLAINWNSGLVAYRRIYTVDGVECDYAGMQEYPKAGVVLGVYDVNKGVHMEQFTVYKSAENSSGCMTHEESKAVLEQAKQYFISLDLDISKKPDFVEFKETDSANSPGFRIQRQTGSVTLEPEGFDLECWNRRISSYDEYYTLGELKINDKTRYVNRHKDMFMMGSGGTIKYLFCYRNKDKILLLERFHFTSGFEDLGPRTMYSFSSIIKLPPR